MRVIGTCSECGGRVTLPTVWYGIYPPEPTCERCGAVAASKLPVIPMQKRPQSFPWGRLRSSDRS